MDRAADELLSAADTVPGVRFNCSAIVFRVTVTRTGLRAPALALLGVFIGRLDVTLTLRAEYHYFSKILYYSFLAKAGPVQPQTAFLP
jgi:hypothetical protein